MKKKFMALFTIVLCLCLVLTGCGSKKEKEDTKKEEGPKYVTKTDYTNIEGIYVDESYQDKDNASLKLVIMFYTVKSPSKNIKVYSEATTIKIGENSYKSERHTTSIDSAFTPNYYFSKYLKEVYVGESLKVMETFTIPEADIAKGKELKFENSYVPETDKLLFSSDKIVSLPTFDDIAKKADPEGYAKEVELRTNADDATTKKVRNEINDYQWTFYVNSSTYKLTFYSPNKFDIKMSVLKNSGIYIVKKGYVALSYDGGKTISVYIKYEYDENNNFKLYPAEAFDVRG